MVKQSQDYLVLTSRMHEEHKVSLIKLHLLIFLLAITEEDKHAWKHIYHQEWKLPSWNPNAKKII